MNWFRGRVRARRAHCGVAALAQGATLRKRWWSGEFGRHVVRPRNGIGLQANARPARDLHCIPSRPNAIPEMVHNTL
ncbi:MAG TPA: hypothetical protein VF427_04895 [Noviherbaspirillum sp.]